jgi:predicted GNAT family acetyltransferase
MRLSVYEKAGLFLERVRPILEQDEATNNLMLGLLTNYNENPAVYATTPYMALVEDGATTLLIAFKTPRARLILYTGLETLPEECFELVAADLATRHLEMPGVLGPAALVNRYTPHWLALKGGSARPGMHEGIYALTEVIPPRPAPGKFRAATPEDAELLAQWVVAFQDEALGITSTFEDTLVSVQRRIEAGNLFVWEDETGRVVTMAGRSRPTRHGATVNAVYTPPELRGKAYASNCVAALSQFILDSGKTFATLFTDLSNPTSNYIYMKMGYKHLGDYDEINFEP